MLAGARNSARKKVIILSDNNKNTNEKIIHLPLPNSFMYKFFHDPSFRKKNLKRFKWVNKLVVPLYRLRILPLFGLGRIFLILTVKGRKTGKTRRVPVEYFKHEGYIYVFPSRGEKSDWYKNMLAHPEDVKIQLGFRTKQVRPIVIKDPNKKEEILRNYLIRRSAAARSFFGIKKKKYDPKKVDFSEIIEHLPIVRLDVHE